MTDSARTVAFPVDGGTLEGDLAVPDDTRGIVLFAHGSGSSAALVTSSWRGTWRTAGWRRCSSTC